MNALLSVWTSCHFLLHHLHQIEAGLQRWLGPGPRVSESCRLSYYIHPMLYHGWGCCLLVKKGGNSAVNADGSFFRLALPSERLPASTCHQPQTCSLSNLNKGPPPSIVFLPLSQCPKDLPVFLSWFLLVLQNCWFLARTGWTTAYSSGSECSDPCDGKTDWISGFPIIFQPFGSWTRLMPVPMEMMMPVPWNDDAAVVRARIMIKVIQRSYREQSSFLKLAGTTHPSATKSLTYRGWARDFPLAPWSFGMRLTVPSW